MISLDNEQKCLLELIKASLFGVSTDFSKDVNWKKVFELSKAQCIVPLISSYVPQDYRNEWLELSYQSKAQFMQILYEQNSLVNLLKSNDISFVILKGCAAAIYYPVPSVRTFGDIDFYISNDSCDSTIKILKENGYYLLSSNERHYVFEKNGVDFELHYRFSCDRYNDIDQYVTNGLSNAVDYKIGNYTYPGLPSYENGLVLLGHIMQHLKGLGIGLRQIIDWMMFVHSELDDSSWNDHFKSLAAESGLERLAVTVTYMCKMWLGLPDEITWCNVADKEVADQLLIRILDDGNLGHERAHLEFVKAAVKKEGSFKYLQSTGMIHWTLAQKYAVFRPFAWLYQLCRYACKGIVGLLTGKKVYMKGKHLMSIEELWKELE